MRKKIISVTAVFSFVIVLVASACIYKYNNRLQTINTDILSVATENRNLSQTFEEFDLNSNVNEEDISVVNEKVAVNPNYIYTDDEKTYYATVDNFEIYDRPEVDKRQVVASINKRDEIKTLGYNDFNNTFIVEYKDDVGYIDDKNVINDINLIFDNQSGQKYISENISLKKYPSNDSENLKSLTPNTIVSLVGKNSFDYYKVSCDGVEGYVSGEYLSDTKVNYVTEAQKKIANIARNNAGTYPCVAGYCAAWVAGVYNAAGYAATGNAIDYWINWSQYGSTSMDNIPIGAVVVGSGSNSAAGNKYGHVAIYIGDGMVAENIGYFNICSLKEWVSWQTTPCRGYGPGFIGWVWPYGNVLGTGR